MNELAGSICYEIRVRGLLGETLLGAFPGLHASSHGKETVLTGPLADQAALYGVLAQLEALGLELLELRRTRSPDEGVDMTTAENAVAVRAVREIFAAIDSGDVDALCRQVTDDVRFQFGNAEVITGRSAFEAASIAFLQSIAAIRHELLELWEVDGGTVITAMRVHYQRLDGQKLTLPCCNLFGTRAGRVHDYRVYMDINPVFAA